MNDAERSGISADTLSAIVRSAASFPDFLRLTREARAAQVDVIHPNGPPDEEPAPGL